MHNLSSIPTIAAIATTLSLSLPQPAFAGFSV